MILKVIVFALLGLGSFALSGLIGAHLPTAKETAFVVSGMVFTYGTIILFSLLGFAGWVSAKV
jgi:hypothetical protein